MGLLHMYHGKMMERLHKAVTAAAELAVVMIGETLLKKKMVNPSTTELFFLFFVVSFFLFSLTCSFVVRCVMYQITIKEHF